jgi:hypothetical protein
VDERNGEVIRIWKTRLKAGQSAAFENECKGLEVFETRRRWRKQSGQNLAAYDRLAQQIICAVKRVSDEIGQNLLTAGTYLNELLSAILANCPSTADLASGSSRALRAVTNVAMIHGLALLC